MVDLVGNLFEPFYIRRVLSESRLGVAILAGNGNHSHHIGVFRSKIRRKTGILIVTLHSAIFFDTIAAFDYVVTDRVSHPANVGGRFDKSGDFNIPL